MKFFFVVLTFLMVMGQALASGFECVGEINNTPAKIIALTPSNGNPDTLTIEFDEKVIYKKIAVVSDFTDRHTFQSPNFLNKNKAPASLFVQIYETDGKLFAQFSETSYLWVVPSFHAECKVI